MIDFGRKLPEFLRFPGNGGGAPALIRGEQRGSQSAERCRLMKRGGDGVAAVTNIKKLMELGRRYKVAEEEDYIVAVKTFVEEARLIDEMRKQLRADGLTVNKVYVKGRENVTAHPLIAEIPKHVDCANRILQTMNGIIETRGQRMEQEKDELDDFRLNA